MAACSLSITYSLLDFMFILLNPLALPSLPCLSGAQDPLRRRRHPGCCSGAPRWSLGQCLPPTCPSALPAAVLAAINYGGSSENSSHYGSGCLMVSGLTAEPGPQGSSPGCRPSFVGERAVQRPLWSLLNHGSTEEDWVLLPPPGLANGCHLRAGTILQCSPWS